MASERYYGTYRGNVYSTRDPLNKRRLRLLVPQVMGEAPTEWAWPVDSSGAHQHVPAVGQGVWVTFEGGDPSFPVWTGTFGAYKGLGYQVKLTDLPKATYPKTITDNIANSEFDVIAAIVDIANKVEQIRSYLNPYPGGLSAFDGQGNLPEN